jgi:microcystin-dependent protein
MPYDANGNYSLPDGYFVENGDTVLPSQHNPPFEDVAQALNNAILRNGAAPMGDDLNMSASKIVNLADAVNAQDAVTKKQLDAYNNRTVPVGSIFMVIGNVVPAGALKANGALVSRTTYAALWTYAQASGVLAASDAVWTSSALYGQFSPGNGSTTFRLPDLRGYFLRAWDDGRGIDAGRGIGTAQADQNASHTHTATTGSAGLHNHAANINTSDSGSGSAFETAPEVSNSSSSQILDAGAHTHPVTVNSSGGNEARPNNVAVMFCIQFQG